MPILEEDSREEASSSIIAHGTANKPTNDHIGYADLKKETQANGDGSGKQVPNILNMEELNSQPPSCQSRAIASMEPKGRPPVPLSDGTSRKQQ
jgi:hypothetical protein